MDLRSARELYSVSLGLATKVLGHNHPATAVHASKLGIVLQVRRRVGSCFCPPPCPGSPFTPFPCHGLFANVQRLGDHDRAAEMLERVLFIHENVLQVRCPERSGPWFCLPCPCLYPSFLACVGTDGITGDGGHVLLSLRGNVRPWTAPKGAWPRAKGANDFFLVFLLSWYVSESGHGSLSLICIGSLLWAGKDNARVVARRPAPGHTGVIRPRYARVGMTARLYAP